MLYLRQVLVEFRLLLWASCQVSTILMVIHRRSHIGVPVCAYNLYALDTNN